MARPYKIGIDFFSTDVDIVRNIKVQKLLRYHKGPAALGVLIALFSHIYDNGYYLEWDDDQRFLLSRNLFVEEEYIQEIIDACLGLGIFDSDLYTEKKILTSRGIQQRYVFATVRRKLDIQSLPHMYSSIKKELSEKKAIGKLMNTETELMNTETELVNTETELVNTKSTQSKVKKSKGKHPTGVLPSHTHTHDEPVGRWSGGDAVVYDTVDEEVQVLRNSPLWKEQVLLRFKFLNRDERALDEYLERWCQEVKISAKTHQCLGDAKWHFNNWMVINENKFNNKNGSHYGANNNNGYRSREDIIDGAMRIVSELRAEGRESEEELPVV